MMNEVNNKPVLVDISRIHPGQSRYSQSNVNDKIQEFVNEGRLIRKKDNSYQLGVNKKGKKITTVLRKKKDALPVIKSPLGYLLIDGHHHVMASLQVGSRQIPIKVVGDYSHLPEKDFWTLATKKNWIHTKDGKLKDAMPPKRFEQLTDDPNRYFAGLAKTKQFEKQFGTRLWIKDKNTPPFAEFKIADIMYQNGLVFNEKMKKKETHLFVNQAKEVLKKNSDSLPKGIKLV